MTIEQTKCPLLRVGEIAEQTGKRCPVIAEVSDHENGEAVARIGDVSIVEPAQLVTRVLLQAARQPGLSLVYDEILSFDGCEIYFHSADVLVGRSYGDATMSFPRAAVIGLMPIGEKPILNPPIDRLIVAGDELVVVALDDSDMVFAMRAKPNFRFSPTGLFHFGLPVFELSNHLCQNHLDRLHQVQ